MEKKNGQISDLIKRISELEIENRELEIKNRAIKQQLTEISRKIDDYVVQDKRNTDWD